MIIHVDMSHKFYERTTVGIAWIAINRFGEKDNSTHKGMALDGRTIRYLIDTIEADRDFARLYAIAIYLIIRYDTQRISKIIICNDEPFLEVKYYLDLLCGNLVNYSNIIILSLTQYVEELGRDIRSPADKVANAYRKRALKRNQWDNGRKLNVITTSYREIFNLWKNLEK